MEKNFSERAERLLERYGAAEAPMHRAFDAWVADHENRPGSKRAALPYDPEKYPAQTIREAKTPAHDTRPWLPDGLYYNHLSAKLAVSLGPLAVRRLLRQLAKHPTSPENPFPISTSLIKAQEKGQNTVVVTPHFQISEIGYFKALRFIVKQDRPRLNRSAILLNKMMSRQSYRGKPLTEVFRPVANILWSLPKSESARKYRVPAAAMMGVNALLANELRTELDKGGLELDLAPTGSELKTIEEDSRIVGYEFPDIDGSSVQLLKNFDHILPAALIRHPSSTDFKKQWKMYIGDLLPVQQLLKTNGPVDVMDGIFLKFKEQIEDYTQLPVQYKQLARKIGRSTLASKPDDSGQQQ